MHQTISGVTHKKSIVKEKKDIDFLFQKEKKDYLLFEKENSCLYDSFVVNDEAYNYFNSDTNLNEIKKILLYEYNSLEKLYPYLGNIFLKLMFKNTRKNFSSFYFNKINYKKLFKDNTYDEVNQIIKYIFENCSLENTISIEETNNKEIVLEKNKNFIFKLEYENKILDNKKNIVLKNYRYVFYDGYIESLSEIHHIMQYSFTEKIPYLVVCKGASNEVFQNVINNNRLGKTNVFVLSICSNEKNLNVMNDIAVLHNADIINIFNGSTISREFINNKSIAKEIIIFQDKIAVHPNCSPEKILVHKNFLKRRLANSSNQSNSGLIEERIKSFNNKNIKIYLPKSYKKNGIFFRELDYNLRLIQNIGKKMLIVKKNNKNIFLPKNYLDFVFKKVNSLKETIKQIEKAIIEVEE